MIRGEIGRNLGYVPYDLRLRRPADRRRFPRYAAMRDLPFDLVSGWDRHDVIVLSSIADFTKWVEAPSDRGVVLDLPDAFLDERAGMRTRGRGFAKWIGGELSRPVVRYRRLVERMLDRADVVVCSTDEQAEKLARYTQNVYPILDLHGEIECVPPRLHETDGLDIVWEGLTSTLPAVQQVLPALRALSVSGGVRLHLVTDLLAPRYMNRFRPRQTVDLVAEWGIDIRLHQWSADKLAEVSSISDMAIVPVDLTDPMAVGKPENRMRIFWRLGLPVVASRSPSNLRAASLADVEGQVLCSSLEDWRGALESLSSRPEDRLAIASACQTVALTTYSEQSLAERWDKVFGSL